jgi:hypothetical protein
MCLPIIVAPLYGILFFYERRAAARHGMGREQQPSAELKNFRRRVLDMMVKFDGEKIAILC